LGIAGGFLVLRAFSSGAVALTGVEAITTGVPAFRRPKARNAGRTLGLLAVIGSLMLLAVLALARATGVQLVTDPATQLLIAGDQPGEEFRQTPVVAQIAHTVFASTPWLFYVVAGATAVILLLAANTAFNGFPQLRSEERRVGKEWRSRRA